MVIKKHSLPTTNQFTTTNPISSLHWPITKPSLVIPFNFGIALSFNCAPIDPMIGIRPHFAILWQNPVAIWGLLLYGNRPVQIVANGASEEHGVLGARAGGRETTAKPHKDIGIFERSAFFCATYIFCDIFLCDIKCGEFLQKNLIS